ncbi:MAG: hypothetical protein EXS17_04230 [Phycisphaerales bacterium]|nr:hypothetical protein [Phycisphaerales bacterium]
MNRFALIVGSTLLLALAGCNNNPKAAAPGAVGEVKASCCKDKAAAAAPGAVGEVKASCCKDKAAAPAPGAVGAVKSGCDGSAKPGCSKSGSSTSCPMSGKTNG